MCEVKSAQPGGQRGEKCAGPGRDESVNLGGGRGGDGRRVQVDGKGGVRTQVWELLSGWHVGSRKKVGLERMMRASLMAKTRGRASYPAPVPHHLRPAVGTFSRTHCPLWPQTCSGHPKDRPCLSTGFLSTPATWEPAEGDVSRPKQIPLRNRFQTDPSQRQAFVRMLFQGVGGIFFFSACA